MIFRLLLAIISFSFLHSCASVSKKNDPSIDRQNLKQDVSDETTIGREIAAKLLGRYGRWNNPKATAYVNLVGANLAKQSGRPELRFHFSVLNSSEENAFACPGGYIFVTKGLLQKISSESELGTVLAHEIAHVNQKHMYQKLKKNKKDVGWVELIARFLTHGYGDIGYSLASIVDEGMNVLLKDGYGQEEEFEADQAGIIFASTMGYEPKALEEVLEKLKPSPSTEVLQKTHPSSQTRIERLILFRARNGFNQPLGHSNIAVLEKRFQSFKVAMSKE